jgi:hypothetical protein
MKQDIFIHRHKVITSESLIVKPGHHITIKYTEPEWDLSVFIEFTDRGIVRSPGYNISYNELDKTIRVELQNHFTGKNIASYDEIVLGTVDDQRLLLNYICHPTGNLIKLTLQILIEDAGTK